MAKKKPGRNKGGHNRGFFYRKGRGWYAIDGTRQVPLLYENGSRIREEDAAEEEIKNAYARWRLEIQEEEKRAAQAENVSVLDVCFDYLRHVKLHGAPKTHADRADTLFDFCFGLPAEKRNKVGSDPFRDHGVDEPAELTQKQKRELAKLKLHDGMGGFMVSEVKKHHVTKWLDEHSTWKGNGRRTRIQAVKRAFNYAVEEQHIEENPVRGYRTPRSTPRVTYITPDQEEILRKHASKPLAVAIQVCIRTGARPGKEFCKLERRHVTDHGDRMEWRFAHGESKTKKLRIIRITDPEIIQFVRQQMQEHPEGPLFRTIKREPWTRKNLSQRFRFLKYRLEKKGIEFDKDCCIYSCRHTYAKRALEGYWTGRPCNIETLARLMGNSPQVCREHYLQWSVVDNEFLWENA